jgi:hypothetical protein
MEAAKKRVADIPGADDWDVMTSAIYDVTGTQFVKIKRGVEEMPEEMKGKTLEDIAAEDKAMDDCMKEYKKGK